MARIRVEGIELRYVDPSANARKFYRVFVADDGRAWTAWGRIGTNGQVKASRPAAAREKAYEKEREGYSRHIGWTSFEMESPDPHTDLQVLNRAWRLIRRASPTAPVSPGPGPLSPAEPDPDAVDSAREMAEIEAWTKDLLKVRARLAGEPEPEDTIEAKLGAALRKARGEA